MTLHYKKYHMFKNKRNISDYPEGLRKTEIDIICDLIVEYNFKNILEVGLGYGSSTVAILSILCKSGCGGQLTSVDPYQLVNAFSNNTGKNVGYAGKGIENIKNAGLSHMHTLITEYDYIALPKMIEESKEFDFIFIDGYHSFDYAFLDFFYADQLLKPGGIVAFHDSSDPSVYKVCQFIIHNKPYKIIGPTPEVTYKNIFKKCFRRIKYIVKLQNSLFRARRLEWCSISAFQKIKNSLCEEYSIHDF